ncbi:A24 family peptidase [Mesorhizobium xinjiangense]|uniref:A24 family peptidase n=1 Tax=Mesorhizobium xinjiangense TaxID=2678685 RepID=UPI0012ECE856|nr:prepilin peptidase [Mesorhizobium xinjiangense]
MIEAAIFVIFPFCMVFAAVSDLMSMTIQNRVSLLLVAGFALIAPMTGMPWEAYGLHFLVMAAVLAFTFTLFALNVMGGGDAKLMAASALWMGPGMALVDYLFTATMLGGALTLGLLLFRNSPLAIFAGRSIFTQHLADASVGIPYGIALGAGGLLAFPASPLMGWAMERLTAV